MTERSREGMTGQGEIKGRIRCDERCRAGQGRTREVGIGG
jgi:hypothetical protein